MTYDEQQKWEGEAKRAGLKFSEWVRKSLDEAATPPAPTSGESENEITSRSDRDKGCVRPAEEVSAHQRSVDRSGVRGRGNHSARGKSKHTDSGHGVAEKTLDKKEKIEEVEISMFSGALLVPKKEKQ